MDDLDRLFQRLVHNIRNGHAEYLSVPFTVQELYDTLVPYRHYRRDLGIETNQDYEAAVTRLLSGEKGYIRADQAMQDRLKKEMSSPHADVGAFRDYAETRISLAPDVLAGKPVIGGTRLAVEFVIGLLADGWAEADILANYPDITHDDIIACLAYARDMLSGERGLPEHGLACACSPTRISLVRP